MVSSMIGSGKSTVISFLLIVTSYIVFKDALSFGILNWDSAKYIIHNECIHGLSAKNVRCMFSEVYFSNFHPLTSLTYALEYQFFETDGRIYHFTNIVIHSLNSILVYFLAKRIFCLLSGGTVHYTAAALSAVLFCVHPQHVETVVWIAERKGLLCTFFILLSFLSYINYVQCDSSKSKKAWFISCVGLFCLSLLSKSMFVTYPVILLLADIYPLKRIDMFKSSLEGWIDLVKEKAVFVLLSFAFVGVTILAQIDGGSIASIKNLSLDVRILNAMNSYFFYLTKWLVPFGLSPYYFHPEFIVEGDIPKILILVVSFMLVVSGSLYLGIKGKLAAPISILFVLIALSPVIGIVQVGTQAAADRYAYIALFPLYLYFGYTSIYVSRLISKWKCFLGNFALVSVVLGASVVAKKQVKIWESDLHLWSYVNSSWLIQDVPPDNIRTLAVIGLAQAYFYENDFESALEYFIIADSAGKFYDYDHYINFARCYIFLGMPEMAGQIYSYVLSQEDLPDGFEKTIKNELGYYKIIN